MRCRTIKTLKAEDFKRSTGVSREIFEKMLAVQQKETRDFGRPPKLDQADQLLIDATEQPIEWSKKAT